MPTLGESRAVLSDDELRFSEVIQRDYRYFRDTFRPAVERLSSSGAKSDRRKAADGWFIIGDVYDVCGAPRAAIRAYRRCIEMEPDIGSGWRELGGMLHNLGSLKAARRVLRKAIAIDPSDEMARSDLKWLEEDLRDPSHRVNLLDRATWPACELLARDEPRAALRLLTRARRPLTLQVRARALGALDDVDAVVATWQAIVSTKGTVDVALADWFFMPSRVRRQPAFWRAMVELRDRLHRYGWYSLPVGLDRAVSRDTSTLERFHINAEYQLARLERDRKRASRVARMCPRWQSAANLARDLSSPRRGLK